MIGFDFTSGIIFLHTIGFVVSFPDQNLTIAMVVGWVESTLPAVDIDRKDYFLFIFFLARDSPPNENDDEREARK